MTRASPTTRELSQRGATLAPGSCQSKLEKNSMRAAFTSAGFSCWVQ